MKKRIFIILPMLAFYLNTCAQSTVDSVLLDISKNNKSIITMEQYWETRKLAFKTGLNPDNPTVEYEYLFGTPANAGNQTDFVIDQSFDFPTAYRKKRQLSLAQMAQAENELTSIRQNVLLEAKLICIELVYRNKFQIELTKRRHRTNKWLVDFQTSLDKGESNILDVHKAKIQLIEINAAFQENYTFINQLNQKLSELNGGNIIQFDDTIYSELPVISDFEKLENEIESNDPVLKAILQEKVIGQKKIELAKAMALPKFVTGYHYQAILGQRFNGVHVGLSIPLWEDKNKVKFEQAKLIYSDLKLEAHRNEHYFHIVQAYEKLQNIRTTLSEYVTLFGELNTTNLLDKSLEFGQISSIEYFMEINYYYQAFENYLMVEKNYYQTVAELYKYRL